MSSSEEGWKRMPEPLEPKVQAAVSCLVGVRGTELRSCKSNSRSRLLIILFGPVLILMRVTIFLLIFSTYIFFCQSTQQREVEIAVYLCVWGGGGVHSTANFQPLSLIWAELAAEISTTLYRNPERPMTFFFILTFYGKY